MVTCRAAVLSMLLATGAARADSWAPPPTTPQTYVSSNHKFSFVLVPGKGTTAASGRMLGAKGAELWSTPLLNRQLPLEVLVADDGRYLVTFDDYAQSGSENAIVIYERGTLRARLGLSDLLTERELRNLPRSISSVWWRTRQRFDLGAGHLIVGIAQGGNRRPNEPQGPTLERQIDLGSGAVLDRSGGAPATVGALLEELKTSPERFQVMQDLAVHHKDVPDVVALWRALLFDEAAPPAERIFALEQLNARLTDAELTRLIGHVADPKDPLARSVLSVVVERGFKPGLAPVLEACKQRDGLDGNTRMTFIEAALKLSAYREDLLPMGLDAPDVYVQWTTLEALAKIDPARARPYALARLDHKEEIVRDTAERVLLLELRGKDPQLQAAAYAALLALARDPKSKVATSPNILLRLGAIALDRKRFDESALLYSVGPVTASNLGQRAFLEAVRGNPAECRATAKKLGKLPKEQQGCAIGWRPSDASVYPCETRNVAALGEELAKVCGGPVEARATFESQAGVWMLAVTLDNESGAEFVSSDSPVEVRWVYRGDGVGTGDCRLSAVKLPKKGSGTFVCKVRLPEADGSSQWPLRADVTVSLYHPVKGKMQRVEARASAFLVR